MPPFMQVSPECLDSLIYSESNGEEADMLERRFQRPLTMPVMVFLRLVTVFMWFLNA